MKRRVLVVDDDPMILQVVATVLDLEEFDVATVESGAAALDALARQRPDLVVCDVMMPEMDGFELVERFRADGAADLPVVMLTARDGDEDRGRAREVGADAFLTKPFSPLHLIEVIDDLLRRH